MNEQPTIPNGKIALPGLLCGVAGGLMAAGLWILEIAASVDGLWSDWMTGLDLPLEIEHVCDPLYLLFGAVVLGFLLSWIILDCIGVGRILFILVFCSLLLVGASLLASLWGWMLSPFLPLVAVWGGGLSALFYNVEHVMPCEVGRYDSST